MEQNDKHTTSAVTVKSVATGLVMMAFFTLLWAGIAYGGLRGNSWWLALLIFPAFSIVFIINAVKLFRIANSFTNLTSEADIADEKKRSKWFGIIIGAEGLGIFIAINVVINLGHPDLTIPVIALVVGLHFYPLAKVFKRTIDYYLATWSTIIALSAIVFTLNKTMTENNVLAFVGTGIAAATSCYGIFMAHKGKQIRKMVPGR